MNSTLTTRALVEGALMTALTVILSLLGMVPIIGSVTMFFYGIPITIVTIHHGKMAGGISAVIAVIITALFMGPISAIINGLEGILLGLVIGIMLHNRKSGNKTLGAVLLVSVFTAIAVLGIDLALMGFSPTNIEAFVDNYKTELMESYDEMGMMDMMTQSMEQQGIAKEDINKTIQSAVMLSIKTLPAMSILGRMIFAAISYFATLFVLKRVKIKIPRMPKLTNIHLPFLFVWLLIIVWALWLLSTYVSVPALSVAALNLVLVCAALVIVDGLSLAGFWLKQMQFSTFSKVALGLLAIFCFTGVIAGLAVIGLLDLLFDIRKKIGDNKKKA